MEVKSAPLQSAGFLGSIHLAAGAIFAATAAFRAILLQRAEDQAGRCRRRPSELANSDIYLD